MIDLDHKLAVLCNQKEQTKTEARYVVELLAHLYFAHKRVDKELAKLWEAVVDTADSLEQATQKLGPKTQRRVLMNERERLRETLTEVRAENSSLRSALGYYQRAFPPVMITPDLDALALPYGKPDNPIHFQELPNQLSPEINIDQPGHPKEDL